MPSVTFDWISIIGGLSTLAYFIELVTKFRKILFIYALLKSITLKASKHTLIIAFES